jgi:hypothetical protein
LLTVSPSPAPADRRAPWTSAGVLAALFLVACAPMLCAPVLPTIDYYDHMSRYFVLSHLTGATFLDQAFVANWSLLPNIGLDLVGTPLMGRIDVLTGAKIIGLAIFAVQYSGVVFFNRMLTGRFSLLVGLLAIPLLYSFIFTWGFANFLLGLGLVFWGAGCWLALRSRLLLATAVGAVVAVAVFLTHGVAFGLYGVTLGGLELGFALAGRASIRTLAGRLAALAAQAIVPLWLFLRSATVSDSSGVTNAGSSIRRLADEGRLSDRLVELLVYRIQTIVRVAEGPALWFDVATFVATGAALVLLARKGAVVVRREAWPALLIGLLLVVCTPPALFGVGYVSDRMPLYLALLFVGALAVERPGRDLRLATAFVALLVVARLAWIGVDWQTYRSDLQAFDAIAAKIPPRQVVGYVSVTLHPRFSDRRRCEMYGPLLVSRHGEAAPLFAIPSAQPMKLQGRLRDALARVPGHKVAFGSEAVANTRELLRTMLDERRFDYVLVCDADRLGAPQFWSANAVAQSGRLTLLRLR